MIAVLPQAFHSWSNAKAIAALASNAFAMSTAAAASVLSSVAPLWQVTRASPVNGPAARVGAHRAGWDDAARVRCERRLAEAVAAAPVLSEAAAAHYWASDDPIGGFGRVGGANGSRFQIVGVVGDVRNNGLGNPSVPEMRQAVRGVDPTSFGAAGVAIGACWFPAWRASRLSPMVAIRDL